MSGFYFDIFQFQSHNLSKISEICTPEQRQWEKKTWKQNDGIVKLQYGPCHFKWTRCVLHYQCVQVQFPSFAWILLFRHEVTVYVRVCLLQLCLDSTWSIQGIWLKCLEYFSWILHFRLSESITGMHWYCVLKASTHTESFSLTLYRIDALSFLFKSFNGTIFRPKSVQEFIFPSEFYSC